MSSRQEFFKKLFLAKFKLITAPPSSQYFLCFAYLLLVAASYPKFQSSKTIKPNEKTKLRWKISSYSSAETPHTRFSVWEMKWEERNKKQQFKAGNFELSKPVFSVSWLFYYACFLHQWRSSKIHTNFPNFTTNISGLSKLVSLKFGEKDILCKCQKCWRMGGNSDLGEILNSNMRKPEGMGERLVFNE